MTEDSCRKLCTRYFSVIEYRCKQTSAGFRSHSLLDKRHIVCNWIHIHTDLRVYLVNSSESTFDEESINTFKSLKVYKYHADGLARNVWTHPLELKDKIVVRGYCFSSLKAKTIYTVYVVLRTTGDVIGGAYTCVAGNGEACSHIAALLFYLEDLWLKDINTLPGDDKTVTNRPQQWHKPPKRDVAPKRASAIAFNKDAYGKVGRSGRMHARKDGKGNCTRQHCFRDTCFNCIRTSMLSSQWTCPILGVT